LERESAQEESAQEESEPWQRVKELLASEKLDWEGLARGPKLDDG
jgi:hypothetical protein